MSEARRVLVLLDDTAAATAAIELSSLVARQVQRPLEVVYIESASALRAAALPLARVLAPGGDWAPLAPQDVERGYALQAARLRALTERIALRDSVCWSMRVVRGALAQAALELRAQSDLVLVGGAVRWRRSRRPPRRTACRGASFVSPATTAPPARRRARWRSSSRRRCRRWSTPCPAAPGPRRCRRRAATC